MEMILNSHRFPFTSTQWQELEHQALFYKYMISGIPIPPHLLFSIKSSLLLDSSSSPKLIHSPNHHSFGWEYFQMGLMGRKIDPEPGRCRRTDGKKWRCSKEAFLDSKYCERHMHRGRNRSRKPVEPSPISSSSVHHHHPQFKSSSWSTPGNVLLMESSPYSHSEKDISCSSGTISASLLEPLAVNNSSSLAEYQNDYSYLRIHNSPKRQKQDQGPCYDLKIQGKDEANKVMHHFFDESPPSNKDKDSSTTQLSISIPSCGHDFFLTRNGL